MSPTTLTGLNAQAVADLAPKPVFDHFQSASFAAGTSILAAPNEISVGQKMSSIGLAPNGTATWQNGVNNPSAVDPALMSVRVKVPGILLVPNATAEGTAVFVRRVVILTFDGETDTDVYTDDFDFFAAHGSGLYVPPMKLEVYRAVAPGFTGAAVINDELTVDWYGADPMIAYPQLDRGHGFVSGRTTP